MFEQFSGFGQLPGFTGPSSLAAASSEGQMVAATENPIHVRQKLGERIPSCGWLPTSAGEHSKSVTGEERVQMVSSVDFLSVVDGEFSEGEHAQVIADRIVNLAEGGF